MTRPDIATLLGRFSAALREAGVAVSPDQTMRLATLVALDVPRTIEELYWCARVTLLSATAQLAAFDAVFAIVFRRMIDVAESRGDSTHFDRSASRPLLPPAAEASGAARPFGGPLEDSGSEAADADRLVPTLASREERLATADFSLLTPDELATLAPLLQMLRLDPPLRLSRRRRRHRRGDRLDLRASLRHSIRSGGDLATPVRRTRRRTRRKVVALLDVSGSMEPYARAYLHLSWGAATRAHAEVFVFGTRLTRLTPALRTGSPDTALERAAGLVPDWSGGTRIGLALRAFMDRHGRRGMAHGAAVLIVSDGWERDDPAVIERQMAALSLRAHRIVWANPRAAAPGFAPLAAGMAAALPYVDALVSGHSAAAMADVVRSLGAGQADPQPRGGSLRPRHRT